MSIYGDDMDEIATECTSSESTKKKRKNGKKTSVTKQNWTPERWWTICYDTTRPKITVRI